MALVPTSMVWAPALGAQRMKSSMLSSRTLYTLKRTSRRFLLLRIGCLGWTRTSQKTLGDSAIRLTEMEQNFNALSTRMCKLETGAAFGSSGPDSARSWNMLGHSDCSTALASLGSHCPGSSDDSRNTRCILDTFSSGEDEHARSAVLLRFPCEQYHTGITKWINTLRPRSNIPAYNKPVTIHCKAGSVSVRLVFETRAKCQDFIARYKDDSISYAINSPLCCTNTNIIVRQSKSIEDREI